MKSVLALIVIAAGAAYLPSPAVAQSDATIADARRVHHA
jgi:hypothetical protein